jgi:predicted nuclease of predicted toxin-antitoxin system
VKLLLDEMWSPVIAQQLRRRGYDVIAVVEREDLRSVHDDALFEISQRELRIIVTDNSDDFCRIAAAARVSGRSHIGLVVTNDRRFSRHHPRIIGNMVTALSALLDEDPDLTNVEHWLY